MHHDDERLVQAAQSTRPTLSLYLMLLGYMVTVIPLCGYYYLAGLMGGNAPWMPWVSFAAALVGTWLFYALWHLMGYQLDWSHASAGLVLHLLWRVTGTAAALLALPFVRAVVALLWSLFVDLFRLVWALRAVEFWLALALVIGVPIALAYRRRTQ